MTKQSKGLLAVSVREPRVAKRPSVRKKLPSPPMGERLRTMRQGHGLTINGLSRLAGVPASTISKIEHGLLKPSFVNAIALASSMGENLGFLVDRYRGDPRQVSVICRRDRDQIEFGEMGFSLQDMNGNFPLGILEARYGLLKPGAHSGKKPMQHDGDELCYVIKGAIRYYIEADQWEIDTDDVIHFKSDLPHRWENASRGRTEVLWVFSEGTAISF